MCTYLKKIFCLNMIVLCFSSEVYAADTNRQNLLQSILSRGVMGVGLFKRYSPNSNFSKFKGQSLSYLWVEDGALQEVDVGFSESRVEVLSPVKPSYAQRVLDFTYSRSTLDRKRGGRGFYWMPSIGVRYQQDLQVVCTRTDTYCFDTYSSDWNQLSSEDVFKPLIALKSGVRLPLRPLWLVAEAQVLSDTDHVFLGLSMSMRFGHLH